MFQQIFMVHTHFAFLLSHSTLKGRKASRARILGLALGLGVGVPIVLAVAGAVLVFVHKRYVVRQENASQRLRKYSWISAHCHPKA